MKKIIAPIAAALLCAAATQTRAQNAPANILANGDFRDEMKGVDVWDPRTDNPRYDEANLPRLVDSDAPGGGKALFFPADELLQTIAVTQTGLGWAKGVKGELAVTYKAPGALDAAVEIVLDWATWPHMAAVTLEAGEGWQTARLPFTASQYARALIIVLRNRGAGELFVDSVSVSVDPETFPQKREVGEDEMPAWSGGDCWAFEHKDDPYSNDALFDLRPLLDNVAGEKGWIKVDAKGDFMRGDGSPIRFWAVGSGTHTQENEDLEAHARSLAKRGVNMVRSHMASLNSLSHTSGDDLGPPDGKLIDQLHKMVATMKRHGIYSTISIHWRTDGVLFWNAARQEQYKAWWRELLTRPNPHEPNQTPLKDDPAFAILQIQNEDSMLFWTQWGTMWNAGRRATEYVKLNAMFLDWLEANNIALELDDATRNWLFVERAEDNYPPNAKLDFRFWLGEDRTKTPPEAFRLSMRFAAETMRKFNASIEDFIRNEIGSPVLINAGNWHTADQTLLLDLERWSYDANEVIGVNKYIGREEQVNLQDPQREGWVITSENYYTHDSCVEGDGWRMLATNLKQVKGKPIIIPESCWVYPNNFQSEGPLLISAYQSLTGVDAYYWFAVGNDNPYKLPMTGWQPTAVWKWNGITSPSVTGGFPAAAWLFHKGYVKRGGVAVDEKRGLDGDLWDLKVPAIAEDMHFDPNRPGTQFAQSNVAGGAPYGAFMIGPVEVEYGKDASGTKIDLNGQDPADLNRGVIRSNTGELFMDAPNGIFKLDAPCAQGVAGFLKRAGPQSTSALDIRLENFYATVIAVSLDDKPLSESGKVLLQITTLSRPHGWTETPITYPSKGSARMVRGFRIDDCGDGHWDVKNTLGTVAIQNAVLSKATLADSNHYAAGAVPVERQGGKLLVKLPPNALYVVLE